MAQSHTTHYATDLMKEVYWEMRMQRLSMNEAGREKEWGEKALAFYKGI